MDLINKDADDSGDAEPIIVESMCMRCENNGITKIMPIRIPFYKQVIIMSFECEHCGYRNNELQSGEPVQEYGTSITLCVRDAADLNRQIIKTEYACITIPEIELEIPSKSQPGEITTVEGVLQKTKSALINDQQIRERCDPINAAKIDTFIAKLDDLMQLKQRFTLTLDDPSGNCYIENPNPLKSDVGCIITHYHRDMSQEKLLGFVDDNDDYSSSTVSGADYEMKNEILHFAVNCPNCGAPAETLMKPTEIPYFQSVIIMATNCDVCGHRTNEVKSGGAIKPQGCKLTIRIECEDDLKRDVLKSDTCSLAIPEWELEVGCGALSGRFTTVEGILMATRDQLQSHGCFLLGDSASDTQRSSMTGLLAKFDDVIALKYPITLVLDDMAGNSYVQSLSAPLDDDRLTKEFYDRSFEQNDELGLNDMKTENYQLDTIDE